MAEPDNHQSTTDSFLKELGKLKNMDSKTLNKIESVLSATLSQLERSALMLEHPSQELLARNPIETLEALPSSPKIACQGVAGAYSHIAGNSIFQSPHITFYPYFEDVVNAVWEKSVDFGILPVENSSAGSVEEVVELVCKYGCYINTVTPIKVEHCLCGASGATLASIKTVYSHPQALLQSAGFLRSQGYEKVATTNTAVAAMEVAKNQDPSQGCLCSSLSANLYGLQILEHGVQDQKENYTRFICISKKALVLPSANTVSLAVSFPNKPGTLSEFLNMFAAFDLDLSKIQSMPIGGADFNVRFHLDFAGTIFDRRVENLLGQMYSMYDDFQFLGNY